MRVLFLLLLVVAHSAALPAGLTTWFSGTSCPDGWLEVTSSNSEWGGRLVVAVASGSTAGLVQPDAPALGDQEDRTHVHTWQTTIELPTKDVSAIGCCDDESARSGQYTLSGQTDAATSGYQFAQLLLCAYNATSSNNDDDDAPFGTVAYFASSCPSGWAVEQQAAGRLIVGAEADGVVSASPSPPLASLQQATTHAHFYSTSFDTADQQFSGVAGCCNSGPSAQGTVVVSGDTAVDGAGLPYVQLLACTQQQTPNSSALLPATALLFNLIKCPPGYTLAANYSGRLLVAAANSSAADVVFGSGAVITSANPLPQHVHTFSGSFSPPSAGVGLVAGCCTGGFCHSQTYDFSGTTNPSNVALPILFLPMCQRSA